MNKERVKEILNSKGVIDVNYKNNPVWLEGVSTDTDGKILVRDLKTNEHYTADIKELEEKNFVNK